MGCDEGLGALFLQCPRRRPPEGQRKKGPQLWYPRLESRRELELLARHYDIEIPFAMLQQLEGELLGRAPLIIAGDRVHCRADGLRTTSSLVLALSGGGAEEHLLVQLDDKSEQWVNRRDVQLDPYAAPRPEEEMLLWERLSVPGPVALPPNTDPVLVVHYMSDDELDEIAEAEGVLLRRLLATGGLFKRDPSGVERESDAEKSARWAREADLLREILAMDDSGVEGE